MAGYVNSWIEKYQESPSPCIADSIQGSTSGMGPLATCWVWLIIGAVIGSALTDKKK